MIRVLTSWAYNDDTRYIIAAGLSTDSKPTAGIVTGSKFKEVDTGHEYLFAEGDTPSWNLTR